MGVATSLGLISGINYEELVSKLVLLERGPITLLQNKKIDIQTKMGALDSLSVKLSSLKSAAETLDNESMFNTKSVAVTSAGTATYLTASTTSDASTVTLPAAPAISSDIPLCTGFMDVMRAGQYRSMPSEICMAAFRTTPRFLFSMT